jgi:alpha-tubulin suppressor-like RCC1 family protein
VQIRAGTLHTCAVNPNNIAYCWGSLRFGELGTDPTSDQTLPSRVLGGHAFRRVVAGGGFTCGVTTADKAYCWGYNLDGELGDGTHTNRPKPVAVLGGLSFSQVVAGGGDVSNAQGDEMDATQGCGVTTGHKAYCWGSTSIGDVTSPKAVPGGLQWKQVVPGNAHACGVTTVNVPYCWGSNNFGVLGIGTSVGAVDNPTKVAGGLQFTAVTTGPAGFHSCGITTAGRVYCWGFNENGQLGDGTTTNRSAPVKVSGQ